MKLAFFVVLSCAAAAPCFAQGNVVSGKASYALCAGCHGFDGEGNHSVNAPKIAGLEAIYLQRQLRSFAEGIRGQEADDVHGRRMAPFARVTSDPRVLEDLVRYIRTLPDNASAATVDADVASGESRYAVCAACHGVQGEGNLTLSAPKLAGLDDWYVAEQLRLYAEGLRGADASDLYGRQMLPFATLFADEQARRELAAFIKTL